MARNKPKNQKLKLSLIICSLLLLTQCFAIPAVEQDRLRTSMSIEPASINPLFVNDGHTYALAQYIFEPLMAFESQTQRFAPKLAKSWEVLPDHKTYRFHLRANVVWQDGKPFGADDVLATFAAAKHPDANANYRYYVSQLESVKKIDDLTVEFVYKDVYFRGLINCGSVPILPKHILENFDGRLQDLFRRDAMGTGPFRLKKWDVGQRVVYERNDSYWGKKSEIRLFEIQFIADDNLAFQKLKKGELDFIDDLRDLQWLKQTQSQKFAEQFAKYTFQANNYSAIAWNNTNVFFKDKRVRQAMTKLFNRKLILEKLKYGNGEILTGPFLPHSPRYNSSVPSLEHNVEDALKLLQEAGIRDSDGDGWLDLAGQKFSFTLMTNSAPLILRYGSIYQEDLRKVGIDMQLQTLEHSVLIDKALKKDFDATFFKWSFGFEDDIVNTWHSASISRVGSYNFVSYQNPKVDALIEATQIEFDEDKRNQLYQEIHALIAEDQPYTFMFVDHYLMAVSKRFTNVKMYPQNYDILEWQIQ